MESGGCLSFWFLLLFILERVALMIPFEKVWSMDILNRLPGVVTFGVSFPFRKVGAMNGVFLVWQEEGSVEHVVDGPRGREVQLIHHWRYLFSNAKGAVTFGG